MANTATRSQHLTQLLLGETPSYDQRQVAQLAGVSLDQAAALWRALGFASPDQAEVMFTDADVEALRIAAGLDEAGTDLTLELPLARALGQSMARMTEWQADLLQQLAATRDTAPSPDPSSDPATDRYQSVEAAVTALLPVWERLQQHVWRRHLLGATERTLTRAAPPRATTELAVGFADIAEFTSTSRGLTDTRFAEFIETFESTSSLVVTDHGGRVVKTIGDEIMFVVADVEAAAEIALTLARRPSDLDGRPELHVGLAYGPVLRHLGDVYGTVVNLASRLASLARPGTVLVDRTMATSLTDTPRYSTRPLRQVTLRGFPRLQPWLLRHAAQDWSAVEST